MRAHLFSALVVAAMTLSGATANGQPAPGTDPGPASTGYAWLGLSARNVSELDTAIMQVSVRTGAWVTHVVPGSPAARAGFREGDVIIGVEAKPIVRACDIAEVLQRAEPGALVDFTYVRGGVTADEPVRLVAATPEQAETISRGCAGASEDESGEDTAGVPLEP